MSRSSCWKVSSDYVFTNFRSRFLVFGQLFLVLFCSYPLDPDQPDISPHTCLTSSSLALPCSLCVSNCTSSPRYSSVYLSQGSSLSVHTSPVSVLVLVCSSWFSGLFISFVFLFFSLDCPLPVFCCLLFALWTMDLTLHSMSPFGSI